MNKYKSFTKYIEILRSIEKTYLYQKDYVGAERLKLMQEHAYVYISELEFDTELLNKVWEDTGIKLDHLKLVKSLKKQEQIDLITAEILSTNLSGIIKK